MGFVKFQRAKVEQHQHAYVRREDGKEVCACGAPKPMSLERAPLGDRLKG